MTEQSVTPVVEAPVTVVETSEPIVTAPIAVVVPAPTAPVTPVKSKGFVKFAESAADPLVNKFGITNSRGQLVTNAYLSRYIQCWCRVENGYVTDRKANFAYFMSDAFLAQQVGKTASQVGKAASIDERWHLKSVTPALPAASQPTSAPADQPTAAPAVETISAPADQPASEPAPIEPTVASTKSMTRKQFNELRRREEKIAELKAQATALIPTAGEPATQEALKSIAKQIEIIEGEPMPK